jgi:putative hydrolase of the HAD superfamily
MFNETVRNLLQPLDPVPTGVEPALHPLPGVRAVLFDVYGTLLVSASGDVGTAMDKAPAEALAASLKSMGLTVHPGADSQGAALMKTRIEETHDQLRALGVACPEVDIRAVWNDVLAMLRRQRRIQGDEVMREAERLAIEYECRVNPVWPMPGARELLAALSKSGIAVGFVSNAQFYTPLIFEVLMGGPPPGPAIWSFEHGMAKPSQRLFELGIEAVLPDARPDEVLYVGNDSRKDMAPAEKLGWHTALFAGDRRSLRRNDTLARPGLVITSLTQLAEVIRPGVARHD